MTFTNKAAQEMRERVDELVKFRSGRLWLGTFHSSCLRILRTEWELTGRSRDFSVYDADDQLRAVKGVMKETQISQEVYHPKAVLEKIERAKDVLCNSEQYVIHARTEYAKTISTIYSAYQQRLEECNAFDFGDLILEAVALLKRAPDLLDKYSSRFRHVLVDEYQDTNLAQYVFVRLLSSKHRNLCVVGDEDQSIYSWRGATIRNILEFERDFPDATIIKLEENYRSSGTILQAASCVIENNRSRKGKELWTRNGSGPKITLLQAEDGASEARQVVDKTLAEIGSPGRSLSDICILYRTNAQSRAFEEEARRMGIPYVIVGGVKFYERKEVKDVIAYLSILANSRDDIALKRVINTPSRGLGAGSVGKLEARAREKGVWLWEIAKEPSALDLSPRRTESLRGFVEMIEKYRLLKEKSTVYDLMKGLVEETGYMEVLEKEGTKEALNRAENIEELLSSARRFCEIEEDVSLEAWLSRVSLFTDIDGWDDKMDALVLMTAHNAKGLEFPVVFMTGLEEGLFPHHQSLYPEEELEEERRLFYVGMTRARERLLLSYALRRMRSPVRGYQRPSRFIGEIPRDLVFLERTLLSQPFRGVGQSYS